MTWENRVKGLRVVKASELTPNDKNWRKHPKRQKEALGDVLDKIGWIAPVIYNITTERLIDGHLRQSLDPNAMVPVVDVALSEEEERLALATFDPIGAMAEAEQSALKELLTALSKEDETLAGLLSAIAEDNAIQMAGNGAMVDPPAQIDKAGELRELWQTERGQVWLVGEVHRVMCGDSTSGEDVARLMDGKRAELLFTSPPYADMRDYMGDVDLDPQTLKSFIRVYKPFCAYQVVNLGIKRKNHAVVPYWDEYIAEAQSAGLKLLSWNVWDKLDAGAIGNQTAMFAISHEWLFVFGENPKKLNRIIPNKNDTSAKKKASQNRTLRRTKDGDVDATTYGEMYSHRQIYTVSAYFGNRINLAHPATMCIELVLDYVESFANEGDICIDPFLGSGTTLIACAQTGRLCYGMEIAPEYVAVVLQRAKDAGMSCERIGV